MCKSRWFVVLLLVLGACPAPWGIRGQERKPPAPGKAQPTSKLYAGFDGNKLGKAYASRFDRTPRQFGVVANVTITPPGDRFKLFRIKGNISDENLKTALASLGTDLEDLAKVSGVKVTHRAKDVGDRPIALLRALFPGHRIQVSSIHGFSFTYEQGKAAGAVDVIAVRCVEGDTKQWSIVCAVHEPKR